MLQGSVGVEDSGEDETVVSTHLGSVSTPSVYHDEDDAVICGFDFELGADSLGHHVALVDEHGPELAESGSLEEVHVQLDPIFTSGANEAHPTS